MQQTPSPTVLQKYASGYSLLSEEKVRLPTRIGRPHQNRCPQSRVKHAENLVPVDQKNESDPKRGDNLIQIETESDAEIYWDLGDEGRPSGWPKGKWDIERPVLVILFGPPGVGKPWVLREFFKTLKPEWSLEDDFVKLNPDDLRVCAKEYRYSLSGMHAATLLSVQREYGSRLEEQERVPTW